MKPIIIQHGIQVFQTYQGDQPLSDFLRSYFRAHPILGSRDRRWIREICYQLFRWSKGFARDLDPLLLVQACLFLSPMDQIGMLSSLPESWIPHAQKPLEEKSTFLSEQGIDFDPFLGWSAPASFSEPLDLSTWMSYLRRTPEVFLRVPQEMEKVKAALDQSSLPWVQVDEKALALAQGSPIDRILSPHWYRIQDASSQACGEFFHPRPGEKWWDCCSGAGGKSMLLLDKEPHIDLWVSDRRKTAISALKERWKLGGYPPPQQAYVGTVAKVIAENKLPLFDQIIADLPCSGSGTWGRTPESYSFFSYASLEKYQRQQLDLCEQAQTKLKPGGTFYYITCSVFQEENEKLLDLLVKKTPLVCMDYQLIHRSPFAADFLFLARLKKV